MSSLEQLIASIQENSAKVCGETALALSSKRGVTRNRVADWQSCIARSAAAVAELNSLFARKDKKE